MDYGEKEFVKELVNDIIYEFCDNIREGKYDDDELSEYFGVSVERYITWEDEYPYSINLLIKEYENKEE